ncbi:MAG: hypothetical protein H7301_02405 [Cryobacterium sp.]|nr:hypothetical protein [Oligoflexia bacterium]
MTMCVRSSVSRIALFSAIIGSLSSVPARAGLEILGQPAHSKNRSLEDAAAASKENRIQVFGQRPREQAAQTVSPSESAAPETAYSQMLREDAANLSENAASAKVEKAGPRSEALSRSDALVEEGEFQSIRRRLRTRQVAEASQPGSVPSVRKPLAVRAMETETITPQKPLRPKKPVFEANEKEIEGSSGSAERGHESNPAFSYTHLLPSPYNLPQGSWVLGTSAAYGLFDFLQVSTNLVRTFNQQWNFQAKVPLIDFPTFMATAYVDYESFNPSHISGLNPDFHFKRWQPGLVTAYELGSNVALFLGGNFNFGDDPYPVIRTSGYLKGARIEADVSWLYNPQSSRLANNALSFGITYDTTYDMMGFGFTHHWRSFSAGVHYTFSDESRFLPIFGFNVAAGF